MVHYSKIECHLSKHVVTDDCPVMSLQLLQSYKYTAYTAYVVYITIVAATSQCYITLQGRLRSQGRYRANGTR